MTRSRGRRKCAIVIFRSNFASGRRISSTSSLRTLLSSFILTGRLALGEKMVAAAAPGQPKQRQIRLILGGPICVSQGVLSRLEGSHVHKIFWDTIIWSPSSNGCLTQFDRREFSHFYHSWSCHLAKRALPFPAARNSSLRAFQASACSCSVFVGLQHGTCNIERYKNSPTGRFANRKTPRSTFADSEKRRLERERQHVPQNASTLKALQFCPWHSKALVEEDLVCPDCNCSFLERRVVHVPLGRHACASS